MKNFKIVFIFLIITGFFSCSNDDDVVSTDTNEEIIVNKDQEVDSFIWKAMNFWYLYKFDVTDLSDNRFSTDQKKLKFLSSFDTPASLFNILLTKKTLEGIPEDRFSLIVEDYVALEKLFSGVFKSNGAEFSFIRRPGSPNEALGFIRYVLPGTDAEAKGIKRGQYFSSIDGTNLTVALINNNFAQLFEKNFYSLGLVKLNGNKITPTQEVLLTKMEYTENPILVAKTLDYKGQKIGYLMYNSFTFDFNKQLNEAFAQFKANNISNLVLDLRYNGGGSVDTATALASMITGQFEGQVFSKSRYNATIEKLANNNPQIGSGNFFNDNFLNEVVLEINDNGTAIKESINSLKLPKVYILATDESASASELIINSLKSYIDVVHIGSTTTGKFQASSTFYDSENFKRKGANTNHKYAIQPLISKFANKDGKTDFINGLTPDIVFLENPEQDLGILGDPNEPFLKAALDYIIDGTIPVRLKNNNSFKSLGNSKMLEPNYQRMYINNASLAIP